MPGRANQGHIRKRELYDAGGPMKRIQCQQPASKPVTAERSSGGSDDNMVQGGGLSGAPATTRGMVDEHYGEQVGGPNGSGEPGRRPRGYLPDTRASFPASGDDGGPTSKTKPQGQAGTATKEKRKGEVRQFEQFRAQMRMWRDMCVGCYRLGHHMEACTHTQAGTKLEIRQGAAEFIRQHQTRMGLVPASGCRHCGLPFTGCIRGAAIEDMRPCGTTEMLADVWASVRSRHKATVEEHMEKEMASSTTPSRSFKEVEEWGGREVQRMCRVVWETWERGTRQESMEERRFIRAVGEMFHLRCNQCWRWERWPRGSHGCRAPERGITGIMAERAFKAMEVGGGQGCICGLPKGVCDDKAGLGYCKYRRILREVSMALWIDAGDSEDDEFRSIDEEWLEWAKTKVKIGEMEATELCRRVWVSWEAHRLIEMEVNITGEI